MHFFVDESEKCILAENLHFELCKYNHPICFLYFQPIVVYGYDHVEILLSGAILAAWGSFRSRAIVNRDYSKLFSSSVFDMFGKVKSVINYTLMIDLSIKHGLMRLVLFPTIFI